MANKNAEPKSDTPPEPPLYEVLENAAKTGDVELLWERLTTKPWTLQNMPEMFELLRRALEVRAKSDPRAFSEYCLSRAVALTAYLAHRAEFYTLFAIKGHDKSTKGRPEHASDHVTKELIPSLFSLHEHLAEMLQMQASTARQWALCESRQIANAANQQEAQQCTEKTEVEAEGENSEEIEEPPRRRTNGNGHTTHELRAFLHAAR